MPICVKPNAIDLREFIRLNKFVPTSLNTRRVSWTLAVSLFSVHAEVDNGVENATCEVSLNSDRISDAPFQDGCSQMQCRLVIHRNQQHFQSASERLSVSLATCQVR